MEAVTVPEDTVFVMGDNRANSMDSRMVGPIRHDQIVGHAMAVIFPFDERSAALTAHKFYRTMEDRSIRSFNCDLAAGSISAGTNISSITKGGLCGGSQGGAGKTPWLPGGPVGAMNKISDTKRQAAV